MHNHLFFVSTAALRLVKQALPCQLEVGVQTYPRAVLSAYSTCALHFKHELPVQEYDSKETLHCRMPQHCVSSEVLRICLPVLL